FAGRSASTLPMNRSPSNRIEAVPSRPPAPDAALAAREKAFMATANGPAGPTTTLCRSSRRAYLDTGGRLRSLADKSPAANRFEQAAFRRSRERSPPRATVRRMTRPVRIESRIAWRRFSEVELRLEVWLRILERGDLVARACTAGDHCA